jgi:hypothetical protein
VSPTALREVMTAVALGLSSSGGSRLRAMVPVQCSPRLGELVIPVGRVSGREEDHVVAVAKRHELQTPKPDHRGQWERSFGVNHLGKWRENDVDTQRPYLACQLSVLVPWGS